MIEIIGQEGTNEYRAAEVISKFFEEQWPNISETPPEKDLVIIRAGACISGYKRNEIDLLIVARLAENRRIRPVRAIRDRDNRIVRNSHIYIKNILAVGEEKSQSGNRIKLIGEEVTVHYKKDGWKSATQQNIEQLHSIKEYFSDHNIKGFFSRFVYLSNISDRFGGAINPTMKSGEFFSRLIENGNVNQWKQKFEYSSFKEELGSAIFRLPLLKKIVPSQLDRTRMELLAKKSVLVKDLVEAQPKSLTQLAGVGGTGKTITMLQVASQLHNKEGERSLFLTYNVTLAADVQRLLALAKIRAEDQSGGIRIQTVYSFFYTLLNRLGMDEGLPENNNGYEDYSSYLDTLFQLLKGEPGQIKELIDENKYEFEFDRVFVDEAQDWHQAEADILKLVFDDVPLYVADGRQQIVRTSQKALWFQGIEKQNRRFVKLDKSLRQKSSIAGFIKGLSTKLDQEWMADINYAAAGGQILLTTTDYGKTNLHKQLLKNAREAKIDNLDWLFLVPPDVLSKNLSNNSNISKFIKDFGGEVHELFDISSKKEIEPDVNKFRVMQYDSCRGLEGWIVVLNHFDTFLKWKINSITGNDISEFDHFQELSLETQELIWNWTSMVLARVMDTLVIHLDNPVSGFGRTIIDYCRSNRDVVDIIN